jgi:hypothetical protein
MPKPSRPVEQQALLSATLLRRLEGNAACSPRDTSRAWDHFFGVDAPDFTAVVFGQAALNLCVPSRIDLGNCWFMAAFEQEIHQARTLVGRNGLATFGKLNDLVLHANLPKTLPNGRHPADGTEWLQPVSRDHRWRP